MSSDYERGHGARSHRNQNRCPRLIQLSWCRLGSASVPAFAFGLVWSWGLAHALVAGVWPQPTDDGRSRSGTGGLCGYRLCQNAVLLMCGGAVLWFRFSEFRRVVLGARAFHGAGCIGLSSRFLR